MRLGPADHDHSPEHRRVADLVSSSREAAVPLLYGVLLHSPAVAEGWLSLGTAIRFRTALDDRTRELVICFVAARTGSDYEWAAHAPLARAAGVSDAELAALESWPSDEAFTDRDRIVLTFAAAVLDRSMDEAVFASALALLGRASTVELSATVAYYSAIALFLASVDVEPGDDPWLTSTTS